MKKLSIGIVCHEATMHGGANQSLFDWLDKADQSHTDYYIIVPSWDKQPDDSIREEFSQIGINVRRAPYMRETYSYREETALPGKLKSLLSCAIRCAYLLIAEKPLACLAAKQLENVHLDAIISNSYATCFGYSLAQAMGIPHIWYVREYLPSMKLKYPSFYDLAAASENSAAISISEYIAKQYVNTFKETLVIHDRIALPPSPECADLRFTADPVRILSVGALTKRKRHNVIIDAVAIAISHGFNVLLEIYGEGEEEASLKKQIEQLGLQKNVYLKGFVENLHSARKMADIAVTASEAEGLGRVSIEAMWASNLVIASKDGFNTYLIEDGKNGLLFPLDDSRGLADKIEWSICNKAAARKLIKNGRATASTYTEDISNAIGAYISKQLGGNVD